MAIRMIPDDPKSDGREYNPDEERYQPQEQSTNGGGGLGNAMAFIPVIGFLFKRPKLLLLIAALAAAYFFLIKPMMEDANKPQLTTGSNYDEKKYDATEAYEPVDNGAPAAVALPERVSLERFAPTRMNQGEQGSCVAWSSAYAARTILEASSAGVDPNGIAFSPAYLYNQIKMDNCQGSLLPDAMQMMLRDGSVPMKFFPYNPNTCSRLPDPSVRALAQQYRTRGFQRLTKGNGLAVDFNSIKQHLAAGAPVVIGMMVPRSFMQDMYGQKVWHPESGDDPNRTQGGHAMCVIGYDDNLEGGAFQIMNSWGNEWGQNGIGWVRYPDFMQFNKEAYGLYPLPAKDAALQRKFACKIGLVAAGKQFISLQKNTKNEFETTNLIPKGTKFKMYVNNELECYTYIFADDTSGKSNILFPYTAKHSPFCGITGVRLFPKDYSMLVDNIGNKDNMAVVITKAPIQYAAINAKINANKSGDYGTRVRNALAGMVIQNVNYATDGKTMNFETIAPTDNKAVVCVVSIRK
jgi:C1A family cysteine protease